MVSAMASRYRLLFRMPSPKAVIASIISLSLLTAMLISTRMGTPGSVPYLCGLLLFSSIGMNVLFKKSLLKNEPVFSLNRMNTLSFVQLALLFSGTLIGFIVSLITDNALYLIVTMYVGLQISSFISFSTFMALKFRRLSLPYIFLPTLMQATGIALILGLDFGVAASLTLASYGLGIVASTLTLSAIEVFGKILGQSPFKFLRGFVLSMLEGDSSYIEGLLCKISKPTDIIVDTLLFRDKEKKTSLLCVVVPRFHPGPVRSIGGSITPYIIERTFAAAGLEAAVLKGLSGHEMDIASREDGLMLAKQLVDSSLKAFEEDGFSGMSLKPMTIASGKATANVFALDGVKVAVVSLHPNPMEDLLPSLLPRESNKIVIIDAHNSFAEQGGNQFNSKFDDVVDLMEKIDSLPLYENFKDFSIGFSRIVPKDYGLNDGLGPGGISCLVIGVDGEEFVYIIVDGNNALPQVRSLVQDALRKEGASGSELLTTDSHLVCAMSLGGRGYHPVGEVLAPEVIAEYAKRLYNQARACMRPAEARHQRLTIKDIRVFSESVINYMAKSTIRSFRIFIIGMLSSIVVSSLMLLVFI
ncbi:MAG: hypothetical protein B9J98_03120 [Candidatus Terraquivivens tikiterensis]|uniref:DUF2070 domain-containing protein n=1 Tax=Candidatus Terraquivivens tikiterensis TaxID=1980982 RepID=A0A2R7Y5T4_9ARCH|nr:MAG: hypothetical protein B9J98_03120 [Candidatus Terraquivivens tikiterensis]